MIKIAKLITGKNNTTKNKKTGVKSNTTKKKTSNNQRPTYNKSTALKQAENAVTKWEKEKPGDYNSKYSANIDALLDDILNREDFKYNMNADPLYEQYRENYIQDGKKAMMDIIGQATALTGGYLNSYASAVGNQVYDEYLNEINEIALELRDRAYEQYADEGETLIDDITILRSLDGDDYDRYWDSVQRYYKDGEYLVDKLASMSDSEFEAFLAEVAAWENDRDFAFEKDKEKNSRQQFKEKLAFEKSEADWEKNFKKSEADWEKNFKESEADWEKNFKSSESKRDQANKDREYNLALTNAQQKNQSQKSSGSTTGKSKGSSNYKKSTGTKKTNSKSNTKDAPKTYKEFYDRTGISSILTEAEFYSSSSICKKYSTYQKYLEKMYDKYG